MSEPIATEPAERLHEEVEPHVLYRQEGGSAHCATWRLAQGPEALALFLTSDAALGYKQAVGLGPEWRLLKPSREALAQLLRACTAGGIRYAVLDPDAQQARRVFDLERVVENL